jgi:serine phosphatase RsbU (regulator of sigma subunit)
MKRCLIILFAVLTSGLCSQTITISGSVFGLMSEKVLLMRKASKNVSFEGPISGVKISMSGAGAEFTTQTDITGSYSITLRALGVYSMQIEKQGYSKLSLTLNYTDDGLKTYYPAVSFMLKKDDNTLNALGEITISNGGKINFIPLKAAAKSATGVFQSNQILLEKAGLINNSSEANVISLHVPQAPRQARRAVVEAAPVMKRADTVIPKQNIVTAPVFEVLSDTASTVADLRSNIDRSRQLLTTLDPTDKSYAVLVAQIKNAESLLKQKEAVIKIREEQLSESQKKVMFLGLFSVFAIISVGLLGLFLIQRKKHMLVLDEKNKNITRINGKLMSSIRYAATIQSNFFKEKAALNKVFGKTFIFNQPKELLSGDFYWFAEKDGHKILVVADCTGHGVPGALLTMLGHSLLDDIVMVKGETLPSRILMALCEGVIAAFSRNEELDYGMDITVLSTTEGSDEVVFSGISNGLYHCRMDKITYLPVTPKSIGPDVQPADLKDQTIKVKKGDCFYMLSDGYEDQFNENKERPEKFNVTRLEELLKKITQEKNFAASESVLKAEIEDWRGTREQIDDMLIVGVRIDN